MSPEPHQERSQSRRRDAPPGLFEGLELGPVRLPRPPTDPVNEPPSRPARRRESAAQPFLPFDRPEPPLVPTADDTPGRGETPRPPMPPEDTHAAAPAEAVAPGEVAK